MLSLPVFAPRNAGARASFLPVGLSCFGGLTAFKKVLWGPADSWFFVLVCGHNTLELARLSPNFAYAFIVQHLF
jgi:hypothetical protein